MTRRPSGRMPRTYRRAAVPVVRDTAGRERYDVPGMVPVRRSL